MIEKNRAYGPFKTEELAQEFLEECYQLGYWSRFSPYSTNWQAHKQDTCYIICKNGRILYDTYKDNLYPDIQPWKPNRKEIKMNQITEKDVDELTALCTEGRNQVKELLRKMGALPKKRRRRVKTLEELINTGWRTSDDGHLKNKNSSMAFNTTMFKNCGKEKGTFDEEGWTYTEDMFVDIEE